MDSSTAAQLNGSWPHYGRWCGSQNGIYGISRRDAASFRLDVRRTDHLGPLLGLLGNVFAEVAGRAWKRSATEVGQPRLDLGISKASVDLLVELLDDLGRC